MNGFVALSAADRSARPEVGDIVRLEILFDEKAEGDGWEFKGGAKGSWIPGGSFTLSTASLRKVESEGNTTKFVVDALVHQPGPLRTADLTLVQPASGKEALVPAADLSVEAQDLKTTQDPPPPWTLPTVPFGGWNVILLVVLALLLAGSIGFLARKQIRKMTRRKKLDRKRQALQALGRLQKYARSNRSVQQEEWKKFSFELANILRRYTDENYKIESWEMTDKEMLDHLRELPPARAHADSLAGILSTIDEVRYGKKALDLTVAPALLLDAQKFVEQTYVPDEEEEGKKR